MSNNPIYLIRHAESTLNRDWKLVEDIKSNPNYVDPPLTDLGRQQC